MKFVKTVTFIINKSNNKDGMVALLINDCHHFFAASVQRRALSWWWGDNLNDVMASKIFNLGFFVVSQIQYSVP